MIETLVREAWGRTREGELVERFTLREPEGRVARVATLGATLIELMQPDRQGPRVALVLGSDRIADYESPGFPAASTIGRVANRIGAARYNLDGREVAVIPNEGPHQLHGGPRGFDKVIWRAEPGTTDDAPSVRFNHVSPDGDQGHPGQVEVSVTYTLRPGGALEITYRARADRATPLNLTNHAYWNLAGEGDVLGHELWLDAPAYTPVDEEKIPTGQILPVEGTPFDFMKPRRIGERIDELQGATGGYDHNLMLASRGAGAVIARLRDPASGRTLAVETTEPAVQLYTGNHLDGVRGPDGRPWPRHAGVCLETQHPPDAVNQPAFPSVILRAGEHWESRTVYRLALD